MLLDVKQWDDNTDMVKLEECVRAFQMPGLHWGACEIYKHVCACTFSCLQIFYVGI